MAAGHCHSSECEAAEDHGISLPFSMHGSSNGMRSLCISMTDQTVHLVYQSFLPHLALFDLKEADHPFSILNYVINMP